MRSGRSNTPLRVLGFPIRTSTDRQLVGTSPWLFAASHVLHRQQTPRHSPLALHNLNISHKDARARNEILKERPIAHPMNGCAIRGEDRTTMVRALPHNGIENGGQPQWGRHQRVPQLDVPLSPRSFDRVCEERNSLERR